MFERIYLDLDRTLLDTDAFIAALWPHLAELYGVDAPIEMARREQFYRYVDDMYDYDFFRHLESLSLGDTGEIRQELKRYLRTRTLMYDDATAALDYLRGLAEVEILTFGNEPYQTLKLSALPSLDDMPFTVVGEHKKHYFARMPDKPYLLIDDKNLVGTLPANVQFIWLDRKQAQPVVGHLGYTSINSLANVKECVVVDKT